MAKTLLRSTIIIVMATFASMIASFDRSSGAESAYWLQFGKPARTCATEEVPFKVKGASWGVLTSGIVVCHQTSTTYVYTLMFLNVFIDPIDKNAISRDRLDFDWCGLALYRPSGSGHDVDWLFERSLPVKGSLRKDAIGKIVFGNLVFEVPRADADAATNMLFYLTFNGPMVVIGAV